MILVILSNNIISNNIFIYIKFQFKNLNLFIINRINNNIIYINMLILYN